MSTQKNKLVIKMLSNIITTPSLLTLVNLLMSNRNLSNIVMKILKSNQMIKKFKFKIVNNRAAAARL